MILFPSFLLLFIHISFNRAELQYHNSSRCTSCTTIRLFGAPLHTCKPILAFCIVTIIVTWSTLKSHHCEASKNSIMGQRLCGHSGLDWCMHRYWRKRYITRKFMRLFCKRNEERNKKSLAISATGLLLWIKLRWYEGINDMQHQRCLYTDRQT